MATTKNSATGAAAKVANVAPKSEEKTADPFCRSSELVPADPGAWMGWQIITPHSLEDVCRPQFFRTRIAQIKPHQIIEVQNEDRTYFARLIVRAVDVVAKTVSLTILQHVDLSSEPIVGPDYQKHARIEQRDAGKFLIFYGKSLLGTFPSRDAAEKYLAEQQNLAAA